MVDGVGVQSNQLKGPGQLEDSLDLALNLSWGYMESWRRGNVREPPGRQWVDRTLLEMPPPPTSSPRKFGPRKQGGGCIKRGAHPGWSVCWSAQ